MKDKRLKKEASVFHKMFGDNDLRRADKILRGLYAQSHSEEEKRKIRQARNSIHAYEARSRKIRFLILAAVIVSFAVVGIVRLWNILGKKAGTQNPPVTQGQDKDLQNMQVRAEGGDADASHTFTDITISFTGDCILGTDEYFAWDTGFNAYYDRYGSDYFFKNVQSIFKEDDLTVVNMEGTLTEETARLNKQFAFKGEPEYVKILTDGSVEAANIANNHSSDYGEQSFSDTVNILEDNKIAVFGYDETELLDVKGVQVGLFGIYELDDHLQREEQVKANISKLKEEGADLIIAVFHWGNELETVPDSNQKYLGHLAVDEGADLVIGHHPHILQGIETYKGKKIVYSLGNFCFGGNVRPTEMDTIIYQQKFTLNQEKELVDTEDTIIPCWVSSETDYNNYQPTPLTGQEAQAVLNKVQERSQGI